MSIDPHTSFSPRGLVFGLILPGAGHMATGQVTRGLLVALGVLGLFFGGIFIGGIDVIDSDEDRVWFIGEAMVGPLAFGIDAAHQNLFKAYDHDQASKLTTVDDLAALARRSAYPDEMRSTMTISLVDTASRLAVSRTIPVFVKAGPGQGPPNKKSISKVNELGTLFSTIAGMMNLIALIDAAFPSLRRREDGSFAKPTSAAQTGGQA